MYLLDRINAHIMRVGDAPDGSHSLSHAFYRVNVRVGTLDQYLLLLKLGHLPVKFSKLALLKPQLFSILDGSSLVTGFLFTDSASSQIADFDFDNTCALSNRNKLVLNAVQCLFRRRCTLTPTWEFAFIFDTKALFLIRSSHRHFCKFLFFDFKSPIHISIYTLFKLTKLIS